MTSLRQSELLGLRWRGVDWSAQRIRVRTTWVRGEHSTDGKSDLSTRRSVPIADRLLAAVDDWSTRTIYNGDDHLVFAHPQTSNPRDGSRVTRRFQVACRHARARPIRFHGLRYTFATQLAASGKVSLRTLQEFVGRADAKTTQIYAHYGPSAQEIEMVNAAVAAEPKRPSAVRTASRRGASLTLDAAWKGANALSGGSKRLLGVQRARSCPRRKSRTGNVPRMRVAQTAALAGGLRARGCCLKACAGLRIRRGPVRGPLLGDWGLSEKR